MKFKEISKIAINLLVRDFKTDTFLKTSSIDITTKILLKKDKVIQANLIARKKLIICGVLFLKEFVKSIDKNIKILVYHSDGAEVKKNCKILSLKGSCITILKLERTILNFVQHLSSISTSTNKLVKKIEKYKSKLVDTRKTITNLRILQKYAVKLGGGKNNRMGLFDEILIKDNHIKIIGGIDETLTIIKKRKIKNFKIECDTINQVKKAIDFGSKYVMLDNMNLKQIKKCIKMGEGKKTLFEITGGISEKNIIKFAKLNAHFISVGFITQNPKPVDIALDIN